jgi:hypothetical protein
MDFPEKLLLGLGGGGAVSPKCIDILKNETK